MRSWGRLLSCFRSSCTIDRLATASPSSSFFPCHHYTATPRALHPTTTTRSSSLSSCKGWDGSRGGMGGEQGKEGWREGCGLAKKQAARRFYSITYRPVASTPSTHHTETHAQASGTITTTSSSLTGRACAVANGAGGLPPSCPASPPLLPPHHSHPLPSLFPTPFLPQSQPWCA